jgi:hypothetical protein
MGGTTTTTATTTTRAKLAAGRSTSLGGRSVQPASLASKQWSSSQWPFFAAQSTSRSCRPQASCEWLQAARLAFYFGRPALASTGSVCVWLGGPIQLHLRSSAHLPSTHQHLSLPRRQRLCTLCTRRLQLSASHTLHHRPRDLERRRDFARQFPIPSVCATAAPTTKTRPSIPRERRACSSTTASTLSPI